MISNLDHDQTSINRCARQYRQNLMLQIPTPFQSPRVYVTRVYYITRERPVGNTRRIESRLVRSSPLALTNGDVWCSYLPIKDGIRQSTTGRKAVELVSCVHESRPAGFRPMSSARLRTLTENRAPLA